MRRPAVLLKHHHGKKVHDHHHHGKKVVHDDENKNKSDETLQRFYPTALTSKQAAHRVIVPLTKYGFTSSNTLLAASICSDEINFIDKAGSHKSLYAELSKVYGGKKVFNMGGLGGVPFVGRTGMSAGMGHIPYCCDDGKEGEGGGNLLIFFAPHVGISKHGDVGHVERCGQGDHISTSCGASVAAFNVIKSHQDWDVIHTIQQHPSWHDEEEAFIVKELSKRLRKFDIDDNDDYLNNDNMSLVSYQMYDIIRDVLRQELASVSIEKFQHCKHIALLGGIIINRHPDVGDWFQPLSFELKTKKKHIGVGSAAATSKLGLDGLYNTVDLYESTFGPKPHH